MTVTEDREALESALALLAREPARQVAALPTFRRLAEEIARGDDSAAVVDVAGLRAAGALTGTVARLVDEIDACFSVLVDDRATAFTEAALSSHVAWIELRTLARRTLMALSSGPEG